MLGPVYANENQESRKQISKSLRQVSAPNFLEAHYTRERSNAKANKTCTTKNHVELFGSNSLYIKYYNDIFFLSYRYFYVFVFSRCIDPALFQFQLSLGHYNWNKKLLFLQPQTEIHLHA